MGKDIHIHATVYDEKENIYKELKLYKPGVSYHYNNQGEKIIDNPDYQKVLIYDGRNSEMFSVLAGDDDFEVGGYGYFPATSIRLNSLEEELQKKVKNAVDLGCYDFKETTLADMKAYLADYPTIIDYDVDFGEDWKVGDPTPQRENPIKGLYDNICSYIHFADGWNFDFNKLSDYKIIYYFDS